MHALYLISEKNCSSHSEFILPGISHQVSAQEDMVWKIMFEEFQDGCSMMDPLWHLNGMISAVADPLCCMKPSIMFLIKRIYGLEEDIGWRIPKWLFSTCLSFICLASLIKFMLKSTWFGRWYLKNSKMAVQWWTLYDILMEWFQLFCVTYLPAFSHQVSAQENIWFGRWWSLAISESPCC